MASLAVAIALLACDLSLVSTSEGDNMTPREADRIIKAGLPVKVTDKVFGETFTALFTHRSRWNIYGIVAGCAVQFDRGDLAVQP